MIKSCCMYSVRPFLARYSHREVRGRGANTWPITARPTDSRLAPTASRHTVMVILAITDRHLVSTRRIPRAKETVWLAIANKVTPPPLPPKEGAFSLLMRLIAPESSWLHIHHASGLTEEQNRGCLKRTSHLDHFFPPCARQHHRVLRLIRQPCPGTHTWLGSGKLELRISVSLLRTLLGHPETDSSNITLKSAGYAVHIKITTGTIEA